MMRLRGAEVDMRAFEATNHYLHAAMEVMEVGDRVIEGMVKERGEAPTLGRSGLQRPECPGRRSTAA